MTQPTNETTPTMPAPSSPAAIVPVAPQAATHDTPAGDSRALNAFASETSFVAAQRMARALASSSLVPQAYQNNIPNVLIAMELASRIGASVFAVMQNLDIIRGRPSWRATFLIATVNGSGRFTPLRFKWSGKEGTDSWGCRAVARDKETGDECLGSLITIGLARAEGWLTKNDSKWKTMPEQMMMYRAAAFWTRVYAPELSLGMQTSDEVADVLGVPQVETSAVVAPGSPKALEEALRSAPVDATPTETTTQDDGNDTTTREHGEEG